MIVNIELVYLETILRLMDEIKRLRDQVDIIDRELITLLAKRFDATNKIGVIKSRKKIHVLDEDRWALVIRDRLSRAEQFGLSESMIDEIWNTIHKYSQSSQNSLE